MERRLLNVSLSVDYWVACKPLNWTSDSYL